MAPPPVKTCSGSSRLSLSSSPPSFTDAELLVLKAALASRRAGGPPGQVGGPPSCVGAPTPPCVAPSGESPPTSDRSSANKGAEGFGAFAMQTPVATQEAAEPRLFLEDMTARIALMPGPPAASAASAATAAATAAAAATGPVAFVTEPGVGLRVCGGLDPHRCVTGLVKEICLPGVAPLEGGPPPGKGGPQGGPSLGPPKTEDMTCDGFDLSCKYVAFVSVSFREACLFMSASLRRLSSLIVKLVVCGDCLSLPASASGGGIDRSQQVEASASLPAALEEADCYLAQLASCVSLSLMPGPLDPTTFALPQRPLHAALLPFTRQFASAKGAPNPHAFIIDELNVAVISALRCYPSINDDPFCISGSSSYHVYFAGLQKQHQHCRLAAAGATGAAATDAATDAAAAPVCVCVPDFGLRGELVLLNLKTLQSRTLRFWEAEGE
ncbi:hypothetical protein Emag_006269 [Eimeria magna]